MILGTAGLATGIFAIGLGIAAVAPLVRNPWKGGPTPRSGTPAGAR